MERFESIFIGALVMFALAFVLSGVLPVIAINKGNNDYLDFEALSKDVSVHFVELSERYPESFEAHFPGGPTSENYAEALQFGRDTYISESCWHCHSQYIRPVSKEVERWGPVSEAEEYNNALSLPPLWGTRRVGPDLSRQKGVQSNDWHVAHLWDPTSTSPGSVMPRYRWFFEEDKTPNKRGLALITYLQWLGTTRDQVKDDGLPTAANSKTTGGGE